MLTLPQIWAHLDGLAKPRRSLGRLEAMAVRLAAIQQTLAPAAKPRRLVLFAGDHGVVARGVSMWPSEVTSLMVGTILAGRASSNALAKAHDCALRLVDVGVAADPSPSPPPFFRYARVARGTRDLSVEPAMTPEQFEQAWNVGSDEAATAIGDGDVVLLAGEMGIGNTTSAACLTALLTNVTTQSAVGIGAGADQSTLQTKQLIISRAVERARPGNAQEVRGAIAALAGFEIAAMAGFFATGARLGATLLLDGYVATAAALVAERLQPGTVSSMIAAHRSAEPGHGAALAHLELEPLLDWGMRLGEGTGALVALPLLDSAAALLRDVALLSELGVARED